MPTAKRVKLDPPGAPLVGKSKAFPVSGSMLKTVIGPDDDKREFHIHEALLTAHSKFFANAMRRGWKEAEEKIVKLSDDEHKVFELYVSLIYIGTVRAFDEQRRRIAPEDPGQASCDHPEVCKSEYESLVELYVVAEKLQDIQARNATVNALIAKSSIRARLPTQRRRPLHAECPFHPENVRRDIIPLSRSSSLDRLLRLVRPSTHNERNCQEGRHWGYSTATVPHGLV
ncbi:hypothetical protein BKA63DRAFT_574954 [Paraphoma chrysanthemicola]|nr:hypothetical protein BKA63DRAFT_574954 [Paraphoma chrysanthemicola]